MTPASRAMFKMVLASVLVSCAAVPALAQAPPVPLDAETAKLVASPRSLRPGETISARGNGCQEETAVIFTLYNPEAISKGEIQSGPLGQFGADIRVPDNTQPGRAWLRAVCSSSDGGTLVSEATLLIEQPPFVISWVNVLFGAGASLIVTGFGIILRRRVPRRGRRRTSLAAS